jgi:hypothetical protein
MNRSDSQRPFIEKAAQDTRDYVQSLLDEVQRLSRAVAELQVEIQTRDQRELLLAQRMAAVEAESRQFAARYVEVEQQNSNLANLYVASYQLHGTLDRERVIDAIKEIIINLVGSEELAIWERDGDGLLRLAGWFGIDPDAWNSAGGDVIGACLRGGERFIAGEGALVPQGRETNLTACIPLRLDEHVVGMIAIFRLLPQKDGLALVDLELFDLLASHAASALYCTRSGTLEGVAR